MIEIRNLVKRFGSRVIFEDLNLDIESGEMLALTGASGSGKSTLLNCLGFLVEPDAGSIVIDGCDITALSPRKARVFRKEKLGYLFQNYALVESITVEQNLHIATQGKMRSHRDEYLKALTRVGLENRLSSPIYELSGGEQQRVALARVIVKKPSVVLADEPTAALDKENGAVVMKLLREFAEEGYTVVVATHVDSVVDSCDRELRIGVSQDM